jgi:hypothetical protein
MELKEFKKRANETFLDFWYDTSFPEATNYLIKGSYNLIFPGERDTEDILISKLFLLRTLAMDYGYEPTVTAVDALTEGPIREANDEMRDAFFASLHADERDVEELDLDDD